MENRDKLATYIVEKVKKLDLEVREKTLKQFNELIDLEIEKSAI